MFSSSYHNPPFKRIIIRPVTLKFDLLSKIDSFKCIKINILISSDLIYNSEDKKHKHANKTFFLYILTLLPVAYVTL